ncbi:hypothetical protein EHW67_02410 [Arenibacter aquaticus]|uniref:Uncharacterized protein n=1 Tax=Arenibacter aquaticus TaxID=2489054 RepID=A0A430K911_9FLAO|nr:hypothetical protein [Arenibacter aquaticus]RTE55439.1 hypothetical protein EHW67_02410 [Arenibacter aquaticus]
MKFRNPILVFNLVLVFIIVSSFTVRDTKASVMQSQSLEFNTEGLYYAEFYDFVFRGHFEHIKVNREDVEFLSIFEQYLRAYARQCKQYLPENKVEIMDLVCAREYVEKDLYGDVVSRTCVKWIWQGSKLFARPDLYNAKLSVEKLQSNDALQKAFAEMTDPNAIGNSMDRVHKLNGLKNDMAQIFTLNSCNSAGIKRFEENLKRYALNQTAIRMKAESKYSAMKNSGGPKGVQNLNKLVDDLVANQAKTWAMNKYVPQSISGLTVLKKDSQGQPLVAKANYTYQFFGKSGEGWVQISFENGLPKCLYFHDFPQNCKTPGSSIVSSYAQGSYAN